METSFNGSNSEHHIDFRTSPSKDSDKCLEHLPASTMIGTDGSLNNSPGATNKRSITSVTSEENDDITGHGYKKMRRTYVIDSDSE